MKQFGKPENLIPWDPLGSLESPPMESLGLPRVHSHGMPWAPNGCSHPWDPLDSLGSPPMGSLGLPRVSSHGIPWAPKGPLPWDAPPPREKINKLNQVGWRNANDQVSEYRKVL